MLFAAAEGAGEVELRVEAARAGKFRDGVKGEIPFLVADCPSGVEQQGVFVWLENAIKAAKNDCTEEVSAPNFGLSSLTLWPPRSESRTRMPMPKPPGS